jgi:hypothetical protein
MRRIQTQTLHPNWTTVGKLNAGKWAAYCCEGVAIALRSHIYCGWTWTRSKRIWDYWPCTATSLRVARIRPFTYCNSSPRRSLKRSSLLNLNLGKIIYRSWLLGTPSRWLAIQQSNQSSDLMRAAACRLFLLDFGSEFPS